MVSSSLWMVPWFAELIRTASSPLCWDLMIWPLLDPWAVTLWWTSPRYGLFPLTPPTPALDHYEVNVLSSDLLALPSGSAVAAGSSGGNWGWTCLVPEAQTRVCSKGVGWDWGWGWVLGPDVTRARWGCFPGGCFQPRCGIASAYNWGEMRNLTFDLAGQPLLHMHTHVVHSQILIHTQSRLPGTPDMSPRQGHCVEVTSPSGLVSSP